jgi:transposase-like protein
LPVSAGGEGFSKGVYFGLYDRPRELRSYSQYLRFSLSYRDVEELCADHVRVWRWVQRYATEMERRLRSRRKPTNDSWRVDETYIRVKGKWRYLYRAVDSSGATIDFLLSAKQDTAAPKRFLAKALGRHNHPVPCVINTDGHSAYPPAIVRLKEGALDENCRHRPVPYLNSVLNRTTARSSDGSMRVSIPDRFGPLGAQSPVTRRFI